MKVQFLHMEFSELNILKDQIHVFINHQQEIITRTTDRSEKYNRLVLHGIGRQLYFDFGNKMVNNMKTQGKTHCTFSVSVAEAAFIQFVCGFVTNRTEYQIFVMDKISRIVDERIESLIFH